jgi:hypothetical protein
MVSITSQLLFIKDRIPQYPFCRRIGGMESWKTGSREVNCPSMETETRFTSHPASAMAIWINLPN